MRILWISNAPWAPSGYGSQTRQAGLRIAKAGYDIEFVANDGTRGDQEWNGHLVRGSSGTDLYSRDSVREDLARSEADWVISLYDAWVYTENRADPFEGVPRVAGWVPVDHFPVPRVLHRWLGNGHMAIAMSQFGRDQLAILSDAFRSEEAQRAGYRPFPVRYVPHAVDDIYVPTPSDFRDTIDVPEDAFLVGIVAANVGTTVYDRKGFGDMAHAMSDFMNRHSDAYLYLHSLQSGPQTMDIPMLLQAKAVPDDRVRWVDQYALRKHSIKDEHMAQIYSSFDLLLATSRGEGFGIPVIEAQACGVPVIASNWTAQAELVGEPWDMTNMGSQAHPNGWLVSVDPDYDFRQIADWGKPRIGQIIGALEMAYAEWKDGKGHNDAWQARKAAAIAKAADYRADVVFDRYWRPLLAEMEGALAPVAPRRERRQAARDALRKKAS